jgi:hypothetical protein
MRTLRLIMRTIALVGWLGPAASAGAVPASQEITEAPQIRQSVEAAIDPDTRRGVVRLPRVTIDTTGDVTVVVALRDEGEQEAIHAAALEDTLRVLSAIYHSSDLERITTATVVGTYTVIGAAGRARELPVLRAVLSAERAAKLDWSTVDPPRLPDLVDVWWMHAGFYGRDALVGG